LPATVRTYPNGVCGGFPGTGAGGGKRGEIVGWSKGAVRRHKTWLYSVDAPRLDGQGWGVTLTLSRTPETVEAWQLLRDRVLRAVRADLGAVRWHWVTEWTGKKVPHLHLAVYFPEGSTRTGHAVVARWLRLTRHYGTVSFAQQAHPIHGPVGWLKYLSKHSARGVRHYQRVGKPDGWQTTGRLWGHGGEWPVEQPVTAVLADEVFYRTRRMVKRWAVSDALRRGDVEAARYLRGSLFCPSERQSRARGYSEWVPWLVYAQILVAAGWDGEIQVEDNETT